MQTKSSGAHRYEYIPGVYVFSRCVQVCAAYVRMYSDVFHAMDLNDRHFALHCFAYLRCLILLR